MPAGVPWISVVVPAFEASTQIERCLAALACQTLPAEQYEVIVVDDGSTDDTANRASRGAARVVRLPRNQGPAQARNAGLAAARGELVVFTDSDCEPTSGFLTALTAPMRDDGIAATKGVYMSNQQALLARFVQLEYESRYQHTAAASNVDFVDTYAACYRREHLVRLGGFDPHFRVCEDQELSFRLAEAGLNMRFVPEARTYHQHADTLWAYVRKKFRIARWKAAVLRKHPHRVLHDSHTPQTVKLHIVSTYAMCISASLLVIRPHSARAWLALATALGVHMLPTTAFVLRCARRDLAVAVAAPGILFLRNLALGAGLGVGLLEIAGHSATASCAASSLRSSCTWSWSGWSSASHPPRRG
jgi:cellulose synthase/poly-beta-1,6-N-acetylglucosamine synthase-like glycosyltransferase